MSDLGKPLLERPPGSDASFADKPDAERRYKS
jgi:hypothetical protein